LVLVPLERACITRANDIEKAIYIQIDGHAGGRRQLAAVEKLARPRAVGVMRVEKDLLRSSAYTCNDFVMATVSLQTFATSFSRDTLSIAV